MRLEEDVSSKVSRISLCYDLGRTPLICLSTSPAQKATSPVVLTHFCFPPASNILSNANSRAGQAIQIAGFDHESVMSDKPVDPEPDSKFSDEEPNNQEHIDDEPTDNEAWDPRELIFHTPLGIAASKGQNDVVAQLLLDGADIEGMDVAGLTPLCCAAVYGETDTVVQLCRNGADVDAKSKADTRPLHYAAFYGYAGVLAQLLAHRADLEAKDVVGFTPLHTAAAQGHEGIVSQLVVKGADLKAKDEVGYTPLHTAAAHGYEGVVAQLVAMGVDLEARM